MTKTTSSAGGRPPSIFEMSQQLYAAAAQHGIAPPAVDQCELWQIGGMLSGGETEEDRRRREDAEVFAERLEAEARGEEYDADPQPWDPGTLRGPLAKPQMPPPPGVN